MNMVLSNSTSLILVMLLLALVSARTGRSDSFFDSRIVLAESTGGCYDPLIHVCNCDGNEESCDGVWTDQCGCGNNVSVEKDSASHKDVPSKVESKASLSHGDDLPSSSAAVTARWTVSEGRWGTVTSKDGDVFDGTRLDHKHSGDSQSIFSSVVPYASDKESGRVFFYLMEKHHFHAATLTISQASFNPTLFSVSGCGLNADSVVDAQDPRCSKLSIMGRIYPCDSDHVGDNCNEVGKASLFEKHPAMKDWPSSHHFYVHELVPFDGSEGFWMISGFGGAADLTVDSYTAVRADEVIPHEIDGGDRMNITPFKKPSDLPKASPAAKARWIVHKSKWATVSTTHNDDPTMTFANVRSVTDGTTLTTSTGVPIFLAPDVDPTAIDLHSDYDQMKVALTFSEANIAERVTKDGLACGGVDVGMPTCAQVMLYGTAKELDTESKRYQKTLDEFSVTHPLATWISQGGSHMGGHYYEIDIERIVLRSCHPCKDSEISIDQYLNGVDFEDNFFPILSTTEQMEQPAQLMIVLLLGCLCGCLWNVVVRCIKSVCVPKREIKYDGLVMDDDLEMKIDNCIGKEDQTGDTSSDSSDEHEKS